jgi:hypothetical protein
VRIDRDGRAALPEGVQAAEEPIDSRGDAFLVRAAPRRPDRVAPVLEVEPLGPRRARVSIGEWRDELSPRHSQILMVLALHPEGMSGEQLRAAVYGPGANAVTARAEISRLRRLLGPILAAGPYRLEARVLADREALERCLGT